MELSALTGTYPVMDGERAAGTLEVTPQGGYLRFLASCCASGREVKRLGIRGEDGEADLGVLVPEDGLWRLDRRFSPAALRALGLGEIRRCFLRRPAPEGWTAEPEPGRLLADARMRRLCGAVRGALTRRGEGTLLLALPLTQPFPLTPLFCLGTFRRLEGRPYLVFGIIDGKPGMIPPLEGHDRSGDSNPMKRE